MAIVSSYIPSSISNTAILHAQMVIRQLEGRKQSSIGWLDTVLFNLLWHISSLDGLNNFVSE